MSTFALKKSGFIEGVFVAIAASLMGTVVYTVGIFLFSFDVSIKLTVTLVFSAYLIYLLWRSPGKTGRVTAMVLWGLSLFTLWLINPTLIIYLVAHVAAIWLIRSCFFHSGMLFVFVDLILMILSLVAATWAYLNTHSLLVSIWLMFLIQALFGLIPRHQNQTGSLNHSEQFITAQRNAESALRKLSTL